MCYNSAAESFHIKKVCSRLSARKAQVLYGKQKKSLLRSPLEVMGNTRCNLRLIEKLVVDLLLVIELFSLGAFVLSQSMRLTDRQTDGHRDAHRKTSPA